MVQVCDRGLRRWTSAPYRLRSPRWGCAIARFDRQRTDGSRLKSRARAPISRGVIDEIVRVLEELGERPDEACLALADLRARAADGGVRALIEHAERLVSRADEERAQRVAVEHHLETALAEMNQAYAEAEFLRDQAERLARTDALTGLANRRQFEQALAEELARSARTASTLGLLILDVDHFKRVNDRHGHQVGDLVLIAVGERLRASVRQYDTVARWGGEEFAALLPEIPGPEALEQLAERVREAVERDAVDAGNGREVRVTASIGIAIAPPQSRGAAFIAAADRALYAAKDAGRNRVCLAHA
jgi:diguanylate cyclase (GGDEF)-like protein